MTNYGASPGAHFGLTKGAAEHGPRTIPSTRAAGAGMRDALSGERPMTPKALPSWVGPRDHPTQLSR
jgi:hypothetical protein